MDRAPRQETSFVRRKQALAREAATAPFDIQVQPSSIAADILAAPGTYPVKQVLQVGVTAPQSGWRISLKCSDLKAQAKDVKDTIDAREVCLVAPTGEMIPLNQMQRIVDNGASGKATLDIHLALVTQEAHTLGSFAGELYLVFQEPQHAQSPTIKIPFVVTVKGSVAVSFQDNKIYFHYGRPGQEQTAAVKGHITADLPLRMTLKRTETGRVDALPLVQAMAPPAPGTGTGAASAPTASIPVDWSLHVGNVPSNPEPPPQDGQSVSWMIPNTPGDVNYSLNCTVKPDAYQAPGDYGMSLQVVLEPVL